MAWSTRELAELAGTTVNTIRHYHRLGLLPEPERRWNGYKQYGVAELVRLLRLRRLVDLGVPLAQVDDVQAGGESTPDLLRAVDADLGRRIERLQQARADVAAVLREGAPADTAAGFEPVAARLSDADNSILHIYTQLFDEHALADVRTMVEADTDGVGAEIDALPADADESTRQRLAERLAPVLAKDLADYPWLTDPTPRLSTSEQAAREIFVDAVLEFYNPAQLDVLYRASVSAHELVVGPLETADDHA